MVQVRLIVFLLVLLCALCALCAASVERDEATALLRLLEVAPGELMLRSQEEAFQMLASGERFFDRTYVKKKGLLHGRMSESPPLPMNCTHVPLVKSINSLLSMDNLQTSLEDLSSFWNRFYTSRFGVESSEWIFDQYQAMISHYAGDGIQRSVSFFNHTDYPQPSVIATIPGLVSEEVVIIGAHADSVNWQGENQNALRAPGACDDGSGTVSVLEVFRALSEAGFQANRTMEFHHYAAEEVGLLGSQDIAMTYAAELVPVAGMFNIDMDGYNGTIPEFSLITDWTSESMNDLVIQLIETYASIGYNEGACGYACSDHASWHDAGYKSSFPIENGPYPYGHSAEDTVDFMNYNYILEYCKVAVGFLVEGGSFLG